MTKEIECKYAKEGKCIDEEECLFHHVTNQSSETPRPENKAESILKVKCDKCPKVYKTLFEVKRHEWRSHEQVDCRLCCQASGSREDLENHKKNKHGITKLRVCKFWANNKCVDGDECLFRHVGLTNNAEGTHILNKHKEKSDSGRQLYCKVGLKCTRQCGIDEYGHKRVKEIPCKFGNACNRNNCHFKHENTKMVDFQGSERNTTKP